MSDVKKVKAVVLKDFTDGGTGLDGVGPKTKYAKGDTPELDEGYFINFAAAGLVEKVADGKIADTKPAKVVPTT